MKLMTWTFLFVSLATFLLSQSEAAQKNPSYFLIGNSLTWDTVPPKLDGDVQWHVDCGKPLAYIHGNPAKPCVKTSTLWPEALKNKQYDYISVQPHYGGTFKTDTETISKWMTLQPKAIFVIHSGWPRHESRAEEWVDTDTRGKMHHSPAYVDALIAELRKRHPGRKFRVTRTQDLVNQVANDIKAGKAPWKDVSEIYRDKIHMNVVTGRYLVHNAMRHAMGQRRSSQGFEKLDPELKAYFDSVLDTLPSPDA